MLVLVQGVDLSENPLEVTNDANGEIHLLSFVVRLWREDSPFEEHPSSWRGHITPVPNGTRHYFTNISEIPDLIAVHLKLEK